MTQENQIFSQEVRFVELPTFTDPRGNLTFIEGEQHVPFPIRRVYYLYDVPAETKRGGHAHRDLEQVVFALSGSFRMKIDNGHSKSEYWLNSPTKGLYINRMIWREMDNFSQGAVCMVLASQYYTESDYFREYTAFIDAVERGSK